jgi:hypothetical protein
MSEEKTCERKKSKPKSPTARSLEYLRKQGYTVAVVEKFNSFTKTRNDLFGFIDVLAIRRNETLAVQATSRDHVAHRIAKISECEHLGAVREAGWKIVVHGWSKMASGKWELREVDVS